MNTLPSDVIRSHHALRGVAALLVLLFHFRDVTLSVGEAIDARTAFFSTGFIWVDFFFMLSGFILLHVYGAGMASGPNPDTVVVRRFYAARLARIYPLHLATLLAMVAVEGSAYAFRPEIADAFVHVDKGWLSILQHLTLTHAWLTMSGLAWNVPSWSISTEAFAYLMFPLLVPLVAHRTWLPRLLLAGVVCAVYAHTFANFQDVENQQPLARCMAGFISGMLLHWVWSRKREGWGSAAAHAQIAAVVLALAALHLGWSQSLVLLAFAVIILSTAADEGPVARILALRPLLWLGTLSYSLYMTHWIFYRLYWMYGDHAFSGLASLYSPTNVYVLKVSILLSLTLAFSLVTYHWIEVPARRHLNRLLTR